MENKTCMESNSTIFQRFLEFKYARLQAEGPTNNSIIIEKALLLPDCLFK